jgi:pyruvate/2-oxoglutarate dehydrogenase complex dihydrolipoamide dehydrogenase (E3) component
VARTSPGTWPPLGCPSIGIEADLVGGECPYWGCIPSKMMIRAAHLLAEGRRIPGVAGASTVTADWRPVAERIRSEATDDWDDTVAVDRFVGKGGTFVRGRGRLVAADTVEVDGHRYRATRAVVVATGTTAAVPPIPGLADTPYWTNHRGDRGRPCCPASIIVLGGGAIGAELAQVYARFDVDVTIVEAADRLLPLEEPEVRRTARIECSRSTKVSTVRRRYVGDHVCRSRRTSSRVTRRRRPPAGLPSSCSLRRAVASIWPGSAPMCSASTSPRCHGRSRLTSTSA